MTKKIDEGPNRGGAGVPDGGGRWRGAGWRGRQGRTRKDEGIEQRKLTRERIGGSYKGR